VHWCFEDHPIQWCTEHKCRPGSSVKCCPLKKNSTTIKISDDLSFSHLPYNFHFFAALPPLEVTPVGSAARGDSPPSVSHWSYHKCTGVIWKQCKHLQ